MQLVEQRGDEPCDRDVGEAWDEVCVPWPTAWEAWDEPDALRKLAETTLGPALPSSGWW